MKSFWKLFGISVVALLILLLLPSALFETPDKVTDSIRSFDESLRWGFIGLTLLPSIIFLFNFIRKSIVERDDLDEHRFNIIPFYPIKSLINRMYPGENIISSHWGIQLGRNGFGRNNLLPGEGITPMSLNNLFNLGIPVRVVETSQAYYVDKRFSSFLTFLAVSILFAYFLVNHLDSKNAWYYKYQYAAFEIFLAMFYLVFWQLGTIQVIRKSWITESNISGPHYQFNGTIPPGTPVTLSNSPSLTTKPKDMVKDPEGEEDSGIYFEKKFLLI